MENIIKISKPSYERIIPTNLEEAMVELDRRIMITGQMNMGRVNARLVVRELLEDYTQGLQSRSNLIIL
jgi:hypothetical protein